MTQNSRSYAFQYNKMTQNNCLFLNVQMHEKLIIQSSK
jgi:hypothetical protein